MLTGSAFATSEVSGVEESSGVPLFVQAQRPRAITPAIISAASDFSFITLPSFLCFCRVCHGMKVSPKGLHRFLYISRPLGAHIPVLNQVGSLQKLFGIWIFEYIQISAPPAAFNQFPILHNMNLVRKVKRGVNFMGNEKITALFFLLNSF